MSSEQKKFWHNPWVVGLGILILTTPVNYLISLVTFWPLWEWTKNIPGLFIKRISIPIWLLVLLCVTFIGSFVKSFTNAPQTKRTNQPVKPIEDLGWQAYNEDTFEGILYKWKWKFNGEHWHVSSITPFCPYDNSRLLQNRCQVCKRIYRFHEDNKIQVLILYKLDNNLWQETLKSKK